MHLDLQENDSIFLPLQAFVSENKTWFWEFSPSCTHPKGNQSQPRNSSVDQSSSTASSAAPQHWGAHSHLKQHTVHKPSFALQLFLKHFVTIFICPWNGVQADAALGSVW